MPYRRAYLDSGGALATNGAPLYYMPSFYLLFGFDFFEFDSLRVLNVDGVFIRRRVSDELDFCDQLYGAVFSDDFFGRKTGVSFFRLRRQNRDRVLDV